ncbi:MAG: prefoldin subunit alpha [Candidatus Diapherotrites archaeon]|uniref:Prefoldin subunit alpha n=1 Tax=Candidatus Iainarchaeum sp. TaxID=3101447 RepID=A0A7J4IU30_9ARCH|nr:MAG: prefoldin alpha subunit [archaeon GW2011_AR10]MBS3059520.1 prefoldin subunit alpha [Candidatus Diapherotrites archaeon]HIH09003.1 prefoldin subunit alpha [Candidatus Diapherotrites archaeon]
MAEKKEVTMTAQQLMEAYERERIKLNEIQIRLAAVQELMQETSGAIDAVKEIQKSEKENRVLVPLGSGVFANVEVKDKKKVLYSIAGNVMAYKAVSEAVEELEKKMEQLRKMIEFSRGEQQKTANNLNQLGRIIQTGRRIQAEQERKLR